MISRGRRCDVGMRLGVGARIGLLVGLCCVAWPVAARAPILPGLSWVRLQGAESCISAITLAQQIEDKLGRSVFVPTSAAELTIEGYVAPRPDGGFAAHLAVVAADGAVLGTRVLESPEPACSALEQALVLVIAVTLTPDTGVGGVSMLSADVQAALDRALDAEVPTATDASASAAGPTATASVARPPADRGDGGPDPTTKPTSVESEPVRWLRLDAALIGGGGMLPSPAFGIEVAAAVMPRQWLPIAFNLQAFLPRTLPSPTGDAGEVRFTLLRAGALLCPRTRYGQLSIEACVGGDTGVMYVTASGFIYNGSVVRPVLDLLLQPNVRVRLSSRAALRFAFSFALPLLKQSVQTRQSSALRADLFTVSALTIALHTGVSVSF